MALFPKSLRLFHLRRSSLHHNTSHALIALTRLTSLCYGFTSRSDLHSLLPLHKFWWLPRAHGHFHAMPRHSLTLDSRHFLQTPPSSTTTANADEGATLAIDQDYITSRGRQYTLRHGLPRASKETAHRALFQRNAKVGFRHVGFSENCIDQQTSVSFR